MRKDVPALVSEEDREAAVARVRDAFAEGHISSADMDERLHAALTATTRDELSPALTSLPDKDSGPAVTIDAMRGRIKRRGAWKVPRVLKIECQYGKVDLDLSRAVFTTSVVDIELRLPYPGARIVLPRNATVDFDGLRAVWKQPVYKAPSHDGSGGPHIRISGEMEYGRLRISHSRR